ncbi:hypothetical protein BGW36DRAFT_304276 [Talaromyces proteolyticus]|uniref:Uncharacterized protein n=1 Tax=Talaromyces proteolyticus TaxID=1131652 RepID=A0AAD4PVU2_9EURO|nr:uncharacterized protein BGW36DRAFT_304276 [Talaromyces proteolyticus]KAH8691798.1 hypothetical protein BGW36DRAFT_304276 [Talaromyces proteolyticus]
MIIKSPRLVSASQIIYSGSGIGTYYYDIQNPYACNQDMSSMNTANDVACWSKTLEDINSQYLVAMNVSELDTDRTKYCGKKVIVSVNGVASNLPLFIGDGCERCATGPPGLDLSYSVANTLYSSVCKYGHLDLSWEVVDEIVQSFDVSTYSDNSDYTASVQSLDVNNYAHNMGNTASETLPAGSCPTGEWQCNNNAAILEQCIDNSWSPRETCPAGYSCQGGSSPYCIIV